MEYRVIGLMSGTSLDGLDLACCMFTHDHETWKYSILHAETVPYSGEWQQRLAGLFRISSEDFVKTDHEYGHLVGKMTRDFILRNHIKADFISSHGHTIFHQPENGFTSQIGNGAAIRAETGLPVVCDFRSGDLALGGQGAPLVPAGDRALFSEFDYCLNLGGFANISFEQGGQRYAFDICPVNIVLNELAAREGLKFDRNGEMGKKGRVNLSLLKDLNKLEFYMLTGPRSLGKEWVVTYIWPLLDQSGSKNEDLASTFYAHIVSRISDCLSRDSKKRILLSGGGSLNMHLVDLLKKKIREELVIPDQIVINYKEALIFAFLGILRWRNEVNCLKSVTGASRDHSSGAIY